MKKYGIIPYIVVYIVALYGHKFVESINPVYDGTPILQRPRDRIDQYIPAPAEGYRSDTSVQEPCLISLNIKNKNQTDRIDYRRNDAKKTDTFIAKQPYIFYQITRNNEILWKAQNDQFFPRVVVKETPTGESFFRIYYNNEATESDIEYDPPPQTAPRADPRTIHQSVPTSGPPSGPETLAKEGVIPVITVDLGYKRSNQYLIYESDASKTREMYTTNKPFLIKKVVQDNEVLWQSRNGMYAYRVLFKQDHEGPRLKVFFPEEQDQLTQQQAQKLPEQFPQQVPQQYPQQVPHQFPLQVQQQLHQQVAQQFPQQVQQQHPQQVAQQFPQQVQQQLPQQAAEQFLQHGPQQRAQTAPGATPKAKTESDSDMDFRIVTRSDVDSPTEAKSEREVQRARRPYYRVQQRAAQHSGSERRAEPRAHPQASVQHPGHPGVQTHPEPQFRPEPRLVPQPKPQPRLRPEDRRESLRDFDYPSSAEPLFERTPRPHQGPDDEPPHTPRAPFEHFSEPEFKSDSDQETRRKRRAEPRREHRAEPSYDDREEHRYVPREEQRHVPGPPQRAPSEDSDERRRRTHHIPLESDGPEESHKELQEPEFRPVSPAYVDPVVLSGKKIPISLDIEFKFCTYLFDYHRHNNLGTYTTKENFIFAKIRRNDKFYCMGSDVTIWQTNDIKVHSTKVNVISDNRVVIHLNSGKTLFYKRGFDSMWFPVDKSSYDPIDWNHMLLELDIGSRRSTQYYEFFSYSKYISRRKGTYLFVARERFRFKMVYNNRTVIWRAYSEDECAYKVGVYRAIGGTEHVTVFLVNGNTRNFMRQLYGLGMGSNWYEDFVIPGYGGPTARETSHVPGPPGRTGINLNLPTFTGQIMDKLSKWYNNVDFSKLYNRNPFSTNTQEDFNKMAQFHATDSGNVKKPAEETESSYKNRTFAFDDDDDEDGPQAEYVDFNANNNKFFRN
ncbi:uncharacterized protein TOT_020000342 [Theileria orientalis strain Shintoku]|uniref:Uncharacterized protein n=1 Tax=Theileria orientalis strain Shintoku TaxID=869250 RepID=J4DP47_THEOR|nr:uncharacterized protein TOT_020000342 [Theileria orientalis strain Shintoku]BAM40079.1 uncharacterized protein TOT_020000342 [Theileria orientalis strain Shintoku]|eukprot:XP_009690380.1 uncharacterized protein TOT_020000342 [Theileria orientalis strain Shintoku]